MSELNRDIMRILLESLKGLNCKYKAKIANLSETEKLSSWVIFPANNYVELENQGPVKIDIVEWIDIYPIEEIKIGRLVKSKFIDKTEEIINSLIQLEISYVLLDNKIRLLLV